MFMLRYVVLPETSIAYLFLFIYATAAQHRLKRLRRRAALGPRPSTDFLHSPFQLRPEQVELAALAEGVGLEVAKCLCRRALAVMKAFC